MKIKKYFFAAAMSALLIIVTFAMASCDSDEASSLAGTSWYQNAGNGVEIYMHFGESDMAYEVRQYGQNYSTNQYTYTFDGHSCQMTAKTIGKADLYGVVTGSAMTVTNTSTGMEIGVFTKL